MLITYLNTRRIIAMSDASSSKREDKSASQRSASQFSTDDSQEVEQPVATRKHGATCNLNKLLNKLLFHKPGADQ